MNQVKNEKARRDKLWPEILKERRNAIIEDLKVLLNKYLDEENIPVV